LILDGKTNPKSKIIPTLAPDRSAQL